MAEGIAFSGLGKLGGAVVEKIGGCLEAPIGRQYRYIFCLNSNLENLEDQLRILETTRRGVQMGVDEAKRSTRVISPSVEAWLDSVNEVTKEVERIIHDKPKVEKGCFNGWCPNLKLRYSLSKKAVRKTSCIERLQAESINFNCTQLSYNPLPLGVDSIPSKEFKVFESRISTMNEIIDSLKNDEINLIGLCGMGGIGKTTMVYEVAKRVKEENLFHEVAIAVVKQQPDMAKIQGDIAEMLGLELDKDSMIVRAGLLRRRLLASEENKRILVILDDVWEEFDLTDLGVPMIPLELLSEDEAWRLFRERAGDSADAPDLQPIAKQIVNGCGRLPLALVIIGSALSRKSKGHFIKHRWEDMLDRLTCTSSASADKRLSSSLELKDQDIPIEGLVRYGMGLSLFEGINELGKVRHRVYALVEDLKSCYLILDSKADECVKVHDVVRDVGISIASRDKGALVRHGVVFEWPRQLPKSIAKLANLKLLDLTACRHLKTIPPGVISGLVKLEELYMRGSGFRDWEGEDEKKGRNVSLREFKFLSNLNTLEIWISDASLLPSIPIFSRLAKYLIVVDFSWSWASVYPIQRQLILDFRMQIPSACGGIDSLLKGSECVHLNGQGSKDLVHELLRDGVQGLEHLKALSIFECDTPECLVNTVNSIPQANSAAPAVRGCGKLGNLFQLSIVRCLTLLKRLSIISCHIMEEVFVKESTEDVDVAIEFPKLEFLKLEGLPRLAGFCRGIDGIEFPQLKELRLKSLPQLKFLFLRRSNLPSDSQENHSAPFTSLFPQKATFPNLEVLELTQLENLEEENGLGEKSVDEVEFPQLRILRLYDLPNLVTFFPRSIATVVTSTDHLHNTVQALFNEKVAFPCLEELELEGLHNVNQIWCSELSNCSFSKLKGLRMEDCGLIEEVFGFGNLNVNDGGQHVKFTGLTSMVLSRLDKLIDICKTDHQGIPLENLTYLNVSCCASLRNMFSPSMARGLVHLEKLIINDCSAMEEVVAKQEKEQEEEAGQERRIDRTPFPHLRGLKLINLPNLRNFCHVIHPLELPLLGQMSVMDCPKMETFSLGCVSTPKLRSVDIDHKEAWKGNLNKTIQLLQEVRCPYC
ncbi:hypothetical protein Acr_11g0004420 [Actinidia rufa]|uniref:NB-ARC domain-containing disease resistance protein n=1 Tax=Actinidia rufa TaxID=165716 RepID=A0A7J0FCH2_9ERIC|nr:hypothetical protein Acr_11g0004420 [Actinidia rufa]